MMKEINEDILTLEEHEELLNLMNHEIIKRSNIINKIPFKFIRNWQIKRLEKIIQKRNQVFRNLRERTRQKYPERFSTQEALK